jgi:glycosyltransferase involved in cell wall biosynthesis
MPVVSIIIPTYKHRDYVLQTLGSVFAQTFTDYEVIVVNDGSPDDTAAVLRPLVEAGKIKYIEQANAGQSAARNRGAAEARGEFLALLDDDDAWLPDKLAWQVKALREHPSAVMAWGDAENMRTGELLFDNQADGAKWQGDRVIHNCPVRSPGQTLIRRSIFEEIGGFDSSLWGTDDFDLYIRLAKRGEFIYERRVALKYRWHAGNASNQSQKMHENGQKVRRKHLAEVLDRVNRETGSRTANESTIESTIRSTNDPFQRFNDRVLLGWYYQLESEFHLARRYYRMAFWQRPMHFVRSGALSQARGAFLPGIVRSYWRRMKRTRVSEPQTGNPDCSPAIVSRQS